MPNRTILHITSPAYQLMVNLWTRSGSTLKTPTNRSVKITQTCKITKDLGHILSIASVSFEIDFIYSTYQVNKRGLYIYFQYHNKQVLNNLICA